MVKTFIKLLLQNHLTDGLETLHVELSTRVLDNCSNDGLALTLTYFTAKSNMRKCLHIGFQGEFWIFRPKTDNKSFLYAYTK